MFWGARRPVQLCKYWLIDKWLFIPKDASHPPLGTFLGIGSFCGLFQWYSCHDAFSLSLSFFSRAFEIPFRSWRVVKSGARVGGFWFQSSCSRVWSVRDGQFILSRYTVWNVDLKIKACCPMPLYLYSTRQRQSRDLALRGTCSSLLTVDPKLLSWFDLHCSEADQRGFSY